MLNPERAAWCVALCTSRAKREKMAKKISGEDDKTKARVSAGGSGLGGADILMEQSAAASSRASSEAGQADIAGGILDSEDPPDKLQWEAVRAHARSLQANFNDARSQLRRAQRHAHESDVARSIGRPKSRSLRSRRFGPLGSTDSATGARSLLARASRTGPASPALSSNERSSSRRSLVPLRSPKPASPGSEGVVNPLPGAGAAPAQLVLPATVNSTSSAVAGPVSAHVQRATGLALDGRKDGSVESARLDQSLGTITKAAGEGAEVTYTRTMLAKRASKA